MASMSDGTLGTMGCFSMIENSAEARTKKRLTLAEPWPDFIASFVNSPIVSTAVAHKCCK